jgi:hypothetical protein
VPVFHNRTAVAANVAASVSFVLESGFDGILLDAEGLSALTPADTAQLRTDLVLWAGSLRAELTRVLPGSMFTWTTDNNATHGNATVYDMAGLNQHLDLFMHGARGKHRQVLADGVLLGVMHVCWIDVSRRGIHK